MVFCITVLRALAACLITNAHYTDVYPTDLIANGGLIGDILFFAVSGYCLYNPKASFPKWYSKRILRCYVPVILITAVYMLLDFYSLKANGLFWWYVYPTYYHFIASIVILYIPYYFVVKLKFLRKNIPIIMIVVAVVYMLIYVLLYDKSTYHIDTVREPMIRFLFFESMLLGALFKQKDSIIRNQFKWWMIFPLIITFVAYFCSKLLFSAGIMPTQLQFINQLLIFALLYFILRVFTGIDKQLNKLPKVIKAVISYIAKITLEIYVVQYVLIELLRPHLAFPWNWLAITSSIIICASALHYICKGIFFSIDLLTEKAKPKKKV